MKKQHGSGTKATAPGGTGVKQVVGSTSARSVGTAGNGNAKGGPGPKGR
jgi:hypothetical protein